VLGNGGLERGGGEGMTCGSLGQELGGGVEGFERVMGSIRQRNNPME